MDRKHFVTVTFLAVSFLALFTLGISGMALVANVALGGTATQSTTYPYSGFSPGPQLAIDGNTDGNFYNGSVAIADIAPQPWWQVNLGSMNRIDSIVLWNRTDWPNPLTNFKVSVLDAVQNVVWSNDFFTGGGYPNPSYTINLPSGTYGQFVKVSLNGTDYLQLAEV